MRNIRDECHLSSHLQIIVLELSDGGYAVCLIELLKIHYILVLFR